VTPSSGAAPGLAGINHVVVLMRENRSFDHMLGYLYADSGNVSPSGQPFAGLAGSESNPDASGKRSAASATPADIPQNCPIGAASGASVKARTIARPYGQGDALLRWSTAACIHRAVHRRRPYAFPRSGAR
jgi:phospholipase C